MWWQAKILCVPKWLFCYVRTNVMRIFFKCTFVQAHQKLYHVVKNCHWTNYDHHGFQIRHFFAIYNQQKMSKKCNFSGHHFASDCYSKLCCLTSPKLGKKWEFLSAWEGNHSMSAHVVITKLIAVAPHGSASHFMHNVLHISELFLMCKLNLMSLYQC